MRAYHRSLTLLAMAGAAWGAQPGVSELGQGITAYNKRDFNVAIAHLAAARGIARLADYDSYYLAYAQLVTGNVDGALATLNAYRTHPIETSPLAGKITVLYGRALVDKHDPDQASKALSVLQTDYKLLPQPDGDFALGLAYEAKGDAKQAAVSYERAFYTYPNTDLAAQAWTAIERLRPALGKEFPAASARQQLDRAAKWLDAKEYLKARQEYATLEGILAGADKDEANVGIGVADYLSGDVNVAFRYLKTLRVAHSETDAERLYYLSEAARKSSDDTAMMEAVTDLGEQYGQSPWRLKALVSAGNRYLAMNDSRAYQPLFQAAVDSFPDSGDAAYCHWKIAWDSYLADKPDRVKLLKEQVANYPGDSRAGTALYFLGRMAESADKYGEAKVYYEKLSAQYPHYFYAVLGRERITGKVSGATADDEAGLWLAGIDWPEHRDLSATSPNVATQRRIERARLLNEAALTDLAESELRFGAKTGSEQPQILALELADAADTPFRAMRAMKSLSGDYLSLPLDNASPKFWQKLFPLPWKDDVFASARAHDLDPFYVAGLIRQESEFNPVAKSRKSAYGLMQLMPATGKMLGKKEGMGVVNANLLMNPSVSIRLGTQYLKTQLDSWDGDWYRTLAAYNAGPGRVRQWLSWSNFREPLEFIESVPFDETREYIQAVLRNADMYRELYSGKHPLEPGPTPKPMTPLQLATVIKPVAPHRKPAAKVSVSSRTAAAQPRAKTTAVSSSKSAGAKKVIVASKKTGKTSSASHAAAATILTEPRP